MRILHVVARSQRRGAELVALELARGLDARGHENRVHALELGFDGCAEPDIPALTNRSDGGLWTLVLSARALRRDLARAPVDIVLAHGGRAVEAASGPRRAGRPALVWQRVLGFPPQLWRPPRRMWWRAVARRVDAAVVLTDDLAAELRRLGFRGPIWTISNFRAEERFVAIDRTAEAAELRRALGLAPDEPLIGWVGHLIEQKRPDRALAVLEELRRRGVRAHLVVAGDGPLHALFTRDVEARGLGAHVHLLGSRNDVERVFGGVDVFLMTSDAEGIPGVLIEAAMTGCPTVTVPVGAVGAVVTDGETGVVTRGFAVSELADRVGELLGDPVLRRRLGAAARAGAGRFSANEAAAAYEARLAIFAQST